MVAFNDPQPHKGKAQQADTEQMQPELVFAMLVAQIAHLNAQREQEKFRGKHWEESKVAQSLRSIGDAIHRGEWAAIFPYQSEPNLSKETQT